MSNNTNALKIAKNLVINSSRFVRDVASSTTSFAGSTVKRTAEKINSTNKKIVGERKKQEKLEDNNEETKRRKAREEQVEVKKKNSFNPIRVTLKKFVFDPLKFLWNLLLAWVIDNLPKIIEETRKFIKKIRIVAASINSAVRTTGKVFSSIGNLMTAFVKNISEFDFTDKSGRIAEARTELNSGMEDVRLSISEIGNVWGREEEQLDLILEALDSGSDIASITKDFENLIPLGREEKTTPVEPQTPVLRNNTRTAGGGGQGWKPILELIASAESVNGSYDSIYPNSIKPGLSQMTIGEADAWQARTANQRGSAAAGRYQFMYIKDQAALAGIGPNEVFSPENQDRMAIALIEKKRKVTLDMVENDPTEAARRLAMEWAGLPVLERTRGNKRTVEAGQSYYSGDGRNKATINPSELKGAFSKAGGAEAQEPQPQPQPEPQEPPKNNKMTGILKPKDFNTSSGKIIARTSSRGPRGGGYHGGIDFGTVGLKGYYAALTVGGKVTFVGSLSGYGKTVIINIGGVELLFAHLERYGAGIKPGASYNSGQPIGEIGNTGRSSGIHLHFEARPPGGSGGSDIEAEPYVKYLYFGKMGPRIASNNVTMMGKSANVAAETTEALQSRRTGGTKIVKDQSVIIQPKYIKVR